MCQDKNNTFGGNISNTLTKTDSSGSGVGIGKKTDTIETMTQKIKEMLDELIVPNDRFKAEIFAETLTVYIEENDRILYMPISSYVYACYDNYPLDKACQIIDNMDGNIKTVLATVESDYPQLILSEKNKKKKKAMQDLKKSVLKIWDHVNLANKQYQSLKQTDEEFSAKFDKQFGDEFLDNINPIKESLTKEMSAQLITMVGIFTALAFLIFGGISSLDNLFTSQDLSIPRLMIIGSVWGLSILNLVFVFLFCVGKMTKLNFKSTEDKEASIFCKYPIVWWCDFAILMVLGGSIWIYYLTTRDGLGWLDECCSRFPRLFAIGGTILLIAVFVVLAFILSNLTRYKEPISINKESNKEKQDLSEMSGDNAKQNKSDANDTNVNQKQLGTDDKDADQDSPRKGDKNDKQDISKNSGIRAMFNFKRKNNKDDK